MNLTPSVLKEIAAAATAESENAANAALRLTFSSLAKAANHANLLLTEDQDESPSDMPAGWPPATPPPGGWPEVAIPPRRQFWQDW